MIYDVIVIGAGVIGSATARELSMFKGNFAVLEKESDVCSGTSRANSAIIHAGFDAPIDSMMAKMNVKGNKMMDKLSKELDINFKRCGAMVLCFEEENLPKLHELYERGVKNGVEGLEILTYEQAKELEPNLSDEVCGALLARTSGIVCPFSMTFAFAENASENGVEFKFNTMVKNIEKDGENYKISTNNGEYFTKCVVNCAGVYSDEIHNMIGDEKIEIVARRGQYILCDTDVGNLVNRTLFQLPNRLGKGILVTRTVHGNLLLGPTAEDVDDKTLTNTDSLGLKTVLEKAALSVKELPRNKAITSFSGLRAYHESHDFIIKEEKDGFFDCAGIASPGLSSAPAIGEYVAKEIANKYSLIENKDFKATRKGIIKASHLSFDERKKLIEEDEKYGNIICRCCEISEAEIVSAINRPLGARTMDGIKLRTTASMGRCQGGFCSPSIMKILSRELDMPMEEINKNKEGSHLIVGKTQKGGV